VVISFEDTGCGMTEAERDHIFTPYFAEREGATGSGLALWLSKLLLESWGGDITIVRSGPGAGTCFEITLPTGVKSPAAEELPAPMAVVAPPAELAALRDGPGELGRVNALVVDDNWSWREVVSHALRQLGCSVFTATNFGEAMGMLESEPIDLAVLDIRLVDRDDTNQDGVRLAQQLSAMNPRAVSILMSGFKIPPEAQRLLDEGLVRAILDKGKQTEFLGALASALSRVDAAREMGPSPGASPRAGRPSGEGK
jgi:CheY-like chemotaxis protein